MVRPWPYRPHRCLRPCHSIYFQFHKYSRPTNDLVYEYSKQLLGIRCFYLVYTDAIQEGDGNRVLHSWKYLLLLFESSGRKNYSIETLNMLNQRHHELTPKRSAELLWTRFVNVRGLPGHNIPGDLHQEHLNRLCKDAIHALKVNKTEKGIVRIGKAMGTISPVLDLFDIQNRVSENIRSQRAPSSEEDRDIIVHQLRESAIFLQNHYSCTPHLSQT